MRKTFLKSLRVGLSNKRRHLSCAEAADGTNNAGGADGTDGVGGVGENDGVNNADNPDAANGNVDA